MLPPTLLAHSHALCRPAVLCVFSLNSWIPIIIKNMLAGTALQNSTSSGGNSSVNTTHATLLSAIPYFTAAIAMWTVAWSSQKLQERDLHAGIPCIFGGVCLAFFAPLYRVSFVAGFAVIAIALSSAYSCQGVVFARVTCERPKQPAERCGMRVHCVGACAFPGVDRGFEGLMPAQLCCACCSVDCCCLC